jgi:hypothetical protein
MLGRLALVVRYEDLRPRVATLTTVGLYGRPSSPNGWESTNTNPKYRQV